MLKTKLNLLFTTLLMTGMILAACEGPEGPTGPQGTQGPQGEQGPTGDDGQDGNANVFYSEWIHADWNLNDQDQNKVMYIEELLLTQDFLDTGAILVYLRHESDPRRIIPLPNYSYDAVGFTKIEYGSWVDLELGGETYNGIIISVNRYDGPIAPDPLSSFFYEIKFRYVLIPGGVPAGKIQDGFWEDYENVAGYFGIPD